MANLRLVAVKDQPLLLCKLAGEARVILGGKRAEPGLEFRADIEPVDERGEVRHAYRSPAGQCFQFLVRHLHLCDAQDRLYCLGKHFRMRGEGFAERILVHADLPESANERTIADERVSERGTEGALDRRVGEITLQ